MEWKAAKLAPAHDQPYFVPSDMYATGAVDLIASMHSAHEFTSPWVADLHRNRFCLDAEARKRTPPSHDLILS